ELVAQEKPAYVFGALVGGLCLLVLFNLVSFFYHRAPSSLWLAGMHAALAVCASANLGLLALWLPDWSYNQSLIADLSALATALLVLAFAFGFFPGKRRYQGLNLLLIGEMLLIGLIGLIILLTQQLWHSWLIYSLVLLAALSVPLVAGYRWWLGYRPARLVLAAMLLFNLGFAIFIPVLLGFDSLNLGW